MKIVAFFNLAFCWRWKIIFNCARLLRLASILNHAYYRFSLLEIMFQILPLYKKLRCCVWISYLSHLIILVTLDHISQSLAIQVVHGQSLLYILRNPILWLLWLLGLLRFLGLLGLLGFLRFRSEAKIFPWPKEDICSDTKQKWKAIETKEVSLMNSEIADVSMERGRS